MVVDKPGLTRSCDQATPSIDTDTDAIIEHMGKGSAATWKLIATFTAYIVSVLGSGAGWRRLRLTHGLLDLMLVPYIYAGS